MISQYHLNIHPSFQPPFHLAILSLLPPYSSSSTNLLKASSTSKRGGGGAASRGPGTGNPGPAYNRSPSQSSSVSSSVNNLVFSPQPPDILTPKGKTPNR